MPRELSALALFEKFILGFLGMPVSQVILVDKTSDISHEVQREGRRKERLQQSFSDGPFSNSLSF